MKKMLIVVLLAICSVSAADEELAAYLGLDLGAMAITAGHCLEYRAIKPTKAKNGGEAKGSHTKTQTEKCLHCPVCGREMCELTPMDHCPDCGAVPEEH